MLTWIEGRIVYSNFLILIYQESNGEIYLDFYSDPYPVGPISSHRNVNGSEDDSVAGQF